MTTSGAIGPLGRSDDLRVQLVSHRDERRSYVVLDMETGCVHARAERFLAPFGEGTQRTYAYHLVDHLRWLASTGHAEESVTIEDLRRYMALCGAEHAGPLGVPWRQRPQGLAAQGVRATCLKGYYLDLTTREDVNGPLRAVLSERRLANGRDRDRAALGHLTISVAANPLSRAAPPRRHPRMLPDGTRAAMLDAVRTARDRMIVTWLSDPGMRIGELCGLSFCDLHLRRDHPCGERTGPAAQARTRARGEVRVETLTAQQEASWRERALNAEEEVSRLRREVATHRRLVGDLMGQLREPDGTWLEHDRNGLRRENEHLLTERNQLLGERTDLARRLDGARANVSRLNERRVTGLFPDGPGRKRP